MRKSTAVVFVVGAVAWAIHSAGKTEKSTPYEPPTLLFESKAPEPKKASAEDIAKQPEREQWIHDAQRQGVISEVKAVGSYPHLVVGPRFYALPISDKAHTAEVVWAWQKTANPELTYMAIDNTAGNKFATYSEGFGFELK